MVQISNSLLNKRVQARPVSTQTGATMIEILVAILILSFGMLGMAALQTRALQGSQSSLQRSQAIMLSYNIMDAMRIDRVQAQGGFYDITDICGPSGISGATLAKNNLRDWLTAAQEYLGGTASSPICGTVKCELDFSCKVQLKWNDSDRGGLADQIVELKSKL
jgi:type IV pilus assembly protein PilV